MSIVEGRPKRWHQWAHRAIELLLREDLSPTEEYAKEIVLKIASELQRRYIRGTEFLKYFGRKRGNGTLEPEELFEALKLLHVVDEETCTLRSIVQLLSVLVPDGDGLIDIFEFSRALSAVIKFLERGLKPVEKPKLGLYYPPRNEPSGKKWKNTRKTSNMNEHENLHALGEEPLPVDIFSFSVETKAELRDKMNSPDYYYGGTYF